MRRINSRKQGPAQERIAGSVHSHAGSTRKPAAQSLDSIDLHLLEELQADARVSFADLSRRVHLSTPAVIERVRRLEQSGVLLGYHAHINPAALGLAVRAIVKVIVAGDRLAAFAALVRTVPEILECHRVTGNESFIAQVVVRDIDHLEQVLDSLMPYVSTNTSIVLNSPVTHAFVTPHTAIATDRQHRYTPSIATSVR